MTRQLLKPHSPLPTSPPPPPTGGRLAGRFAERFGGYGEPFWVVIGGTAVNRIGNMVVPFLVFFLATRQVPADSIPYISGALGIGGLVGPVLGGLMNDRLGGRTALLVGLVATAVSQGVLFVAPNLPALGAAAALLGAAGGLHPPASSAMVADAAPPARRMVAFGLYHWAINVGTAVAGAIGGFLLEHGYGLLFGLDALTCLAYAGLVAARLPRADRRVQSDRPPRVAGDVGGDVRAEGDRGYRVVLRDRLMLALVALIAVSQALYAQTEFTLPLAIRDHGLPATAFGLVCVVNALIVVALQPFSSFWFARFDRVRVWAVASTLIAVGVGLTGVAHSTWQFVLTVVVWSIGEVCASGIVTAITADLAPAGAHGRYQGAANWAHGLARFVALALGAAVYTGFGPSALWWGCGVLGVLGAVASLGIVRAVAARSAAAGAGAGAAHAGSEAGA
ncbi:MFS family permease [Kitasatospora sp. MAP12-15]|uniref:MFS transporter n=1 Tax=unclassified Kitasatospora TaxID=2633591 RepID=UPI0024771F74|nr:MFS transporter [Kitasatospora sp. MAP12-44]MDH6113444.1 MFS family permease [Kitasatospora sp. MAP12-44]